MSILFGVRAADGQSIREGHLWRLARATERYAPDGTFARESGSVAMGFQPYRTHERSKLEVQPFIGAYGDMLTFDGRLDNHEELEDLLELPRLATSDSEIVLAAFRRWGEGCFSRFIGDWAIALWSCADSSLHLARDHAGARTLYYEMAHGRLTWGTYLETFFVETAPRELDEVYVARYLASQPVRDRTPYKAIRAVPPAHCIRIKGDTITVKAHWNCMVKDAIRYRTDAEYEEHFLSLFEQAVRRRTGPGAPVIAQLSGGVDSSSIVRMSDLILRREGANSGDLIDTISHYDDAEPNWDERPYFSAVENVRGKSGLHIPVSFESRTFSVQSIPPEAYLWPGADSGSLAQEQELFRILLPMGFRAIVSGLGGDELLGGVPAGTPELADLLARAKFGRLCKQAYRWCLPSRTPLLHELADTISSAWKVYFVSAPQGRKGPDWIADGLQLRQPWRSDLRGLPGRLKLLPSRLFAAKVWESILGTLPHLQPGFLARYEFRYPYLDRDLVEFLMAVPRTQLVRPGRRRYMMRNAMKGIVPDIVLERKRKASVERAPIATFHKHHRTLDELFASSQLVNRGLIESSRFRAARERVSVSSTAEEWPSLLRAVNLEIWLRGLSGRISKGSASAPPLPTKVPRLMET